MDTSAAAYASTEGSGKAARLKADILNLLHIYTSGLTADEAAEKLNESVLAVRPRFTELKQANRISDTGIRRRNASGKNAAVWERVSEYVA